MRGKFTAILLISFVLDGFSQGIINNGAQITFAGGGQIYIAGTGSQGNYLSQSGGIINPSATGIITMEGDWTNNSANTGFGSDNGTVIFNGAAQSINGSNSTTFYNLTLQGSGTKTQNLNTSVGGVTTTNGILSLGTRPYDLNSFTLTITNPVAGGITNSTGYIISETNLASNPSNIRWNMSTTTGAHIYPFGTVSGVQIPLTFNKISATAADINIATRPTAANDNLPWSTPVTHMFSPLIGGNGSIPVVIDRWWDVLASSTTNADITYSYRGLENTLTVPYNTSNLGAQNWNGGWLPPVGSNGAVLVGVGTVLASGLTIGTSPAQTPWVLSSLLAPLPIELIDFSVACTENNKVILNWSTASEKNSSHFDIMNSEDGVIFKKIASVQAAGNSSSIKKYSHLVEGKNKMGSYYRLKIVDSDFSFKNSEVEFVGDKCDLVKNIPEMYYNSQTGIVITTSVKNETNYTLKIIDAAGRIIRNDVLLVSPGYNTLVVDSQLSNGVYLVNLIYDNGEMLTKKIVSSN